MKKDKTPKVKKTPSLFLSILPLIFMFIVVAVGKGVYNLRIEVLLLISAGFAAILATYLNVTWDEMFEEIGNKIHKSLGALLLLIVVGTIIGSWMASGTIPMMIYYGIQIISPSWLLVTAFLLTAIISVATGTSWGSVSTVGVALMGVAIGFNSNLAAVAGAIVAGSYFGDKMSPLSDTTNLAPIAAGSELYSHIKHMLWTTIPVSVISIIVYTVVGLSSSTDGLVVSDTVSNMLVNLDSMYKWNLLLLLPPLIVLIGSIMQKPSIPVMLISSAFAGVEAFFIQHISLENIFVSLVKGFNTSMITSPDFNPDIILPEISKLLNRGGMISMMSTILIVLCAFAFSGILASSGSMDVILQTLIKSAKTTGSLVLSTVLSCIVIATTTGSVHLTILLPGELFKDVYKERGLAAVNLSRTLEDAGTVLVPIIPWSTSGIYMAQCLDVPVMSFFPWAILCYLCTVFAVIYGFTGIGIKKIEQASNVA